MLKFVPISVSSLSEIRTLCHFMKVMTAGWLNFSERRQEFSGLFLRLLSFFTCHMTYGPQSFATEQQSLIFLRFCLSFFSLLPDGSTNWISSEGHNINMIFFSHSM